VKLHPQTGPVTAQGKAIVSQNATTHGGTSEKLIASGERREDFEALFNDLLEEYAPSTVQARSLVEDTALARWFLWRKQRAYNAVESALCAAQPAQELWTAEAYHQLALVDRYKTAAERALKRTLQNLDALRRLELHQQRHEIRSQKEEAQAQLVIARAHDAIERREKEQWKAACNGFDSPTLVQEITVRVTSDSTLTFMKPSNQALLRQLDRPSPFPPRKVVRKFHFPQGMPPEYYAFTDRQDYRREKGHTIEQPFAIETWRKTVAEEQRLATGHAVPGPSPDGDFVS
jgi:hypothetical protein